MIPQNGRKVSSINKPTRRRHIAFHEGQLPRDSTLAWIVNSTLHSAAQHEVKTDPARGISEALIALRRITEKYSAIFDDVDRPPLRAAS